jgi:soluble cytochrome b562
MANTVKQPADNEKYASDEEIDAIMDNISETAKASAAAFAAKEAAALAAAAAKQKTNSFKLSQKYRESPENKYTKYAIGNLNENEDAAKNGTLEGNTEQLFDLRNYHNFRSAKEEFVTDAISNRLRQINGNRIL